MGIFYKRCVNFVSLSRGGGCIYTCLVRVSFTSLAGEGIGFIPAFFLVICTSLLRECFLLYLCSGSVINTCLGGSLLGFVGVHPYWTYSVGRGVIGTCLGVTCLNLWEYLCTVPIKCVCVEWGWGGRCTCLEDWLDLCGYSLAVPI